MRSAAERPIRFLVAIAAVEAVLAAVSSTEHVVALLQGRRTWEAWLGGLTAAGLIVLIYAIARVARQAGDMRAQVRHRDASLAASADVTADWLWEATPDLVLTYSSARVAHVLGYSAQEVVGRDVHDFMTPPAAAVSRQALTTGRTLDGWDDVAADWLHADGSVVPVEHSGAAIRDEQGRVTRYRGTCRPAGAGVDAQRVALLRSSIEQVLATRDLRVALQPIIDVATGRLVGAEALARFSDGRRPDIWFDEAGEAGLRLELEMLAVERALDALQHLPPDVFLSVNACPEVIVNPSFAAAMTSGVVPRGRLVIEITEHVRVAQYEDVVEALVPLRQAGIRLAIDDTGAGYASFEHVLRLRPDLIKLDRSLVTGIADDPARQALITALVHLALQLEASVTAEGVETAAEYEMALSLGVDHVQGYLIGHPTTDVEMWQRGFFDPQASAAAH